MVRHRRFNASPAAGLVGVNNRRLFSAIAMSQPNTQQSHTSDYQQTMEYASPPKLEMLYLCAGQRVSRL